MVFLIDRSSLNLARLLRSRNTAELANVCSVTYRYYPDYFLSTGVLHRIPTERGGCQFAFLADKAHGFTSSCDVALLFQESIDLGDARGEIKRVLGARRVPSDGPFAIISADQARMVYGVSLSALTGWVYNLCQAATRSTNDRFWQVRTTARYTSELATQQGRMLRHFSVVTAIQPPQER